jgi:serine/threonine protein kinase
VSDIQALIEAFFDGKASLAELESAIDQYAQSPEVSQEILSNIEAAFKDGRLPTQVYHMLRTRLENSSSTADERTVHVASQEVDATKIVSKPPTQPESPPPPEPTRFVSPTEEATNLELPDETRVVRTEIIDPPFPLEATVTEAAPGMEQQSRPTGSNWSRPDQWRDTQDGQIKPGSIINNRFVIESQLGKGGMGVVFKARDRRKEEAHDADPYIAIKILNEEFRNHPQALVSLQREATKAQTLAHPNIITVYDFDRDGTTVYMTMELMRGQSLSEYIRSFRQGGASPEEAARIITEMAAGLSYAHKRQIVHSDFKPGNVFLTEDNRVKILDFGIARATQYGGVEAVKDEFDAGELGAMTPGFASLEMLNGEPPDPSDDVYALAVTAYQLLTGDHPFDRKTAKEALVKKLSPRPIKGIKRREWRTIARGLELRREERIPDAAQFLRKFRGPTKLSKISAAAIIILSLSAAFFAWESVQAPGPDVPFEELSMQDQTNFNKSIAEGESFLNVGAPWMAVKSFAIAYDYHPRNPIAEERLEQSMNAWIDLASGHAISDKARQDAVDDMRLEQAANEHLENYDRLNEFLQSHERGTGIETSN